MKKSELSKGRRIIRAADRTVDTIVLILLILMLMFGIYSLVDSKLVYMSADASNYEEYKPAENDSKSFAELQRINPEVFGWLTIIGTEVDYPVCQAEDNDKYVNTNAMGEYSLVGSLFLDFRNRQDFSDFNSIIYGHHMEQDKLFGCFDKYRDAGFLKEHSRANLYFGGKKHGVELFAFIVADAYDYDYYTVCGETSSAEARQAYLDHIMQTALTTLPAEVTTDDRLIVLSTCSEDITNGRFILVGKLTDKPFKEPEKAKKRTGLGLGNSDSLLSRIPVWQTAVLLAIAALMLVYAVSLAADRLRKRRKNSTDTKDKKHVNEGNTTDRQ